MGYTLGKRMIAYPPRPSHDVGAPPKMTGGLPKAGSVLTVNTGVWYGQGTMVPAFMWFLGTASAYASATWASYSVSANNSGVGLSCRFRMGNAVWGTTERMLGTGTVIP